MTVTYPKDVEGVKRFTPFLTPKKPEVFLINQEFKPFGVREYTGVRARETPIQYSRVVYSLPSLNASNSFFFLYILGVLYGV